MELRLWIKAARGRASALADHLHIKPSYLSQIASGGPCSVRLAIEIEKFTNGAVRCESLRPADEDWAYLRGTAYSSSGAKLPS
ncbi:transcriptional regulator [Chitinilyticum aquatile]|uniref:transcriptional regulator n=1 Tax=Chitinilyticum aquatile TaxID=362520 RepID=UPI0009D6A41A